METNIVKKMIKETEGTLLDFKAEFYNIQNSKSKVDFIKDMLSFANSTMEQDGYIICGIKEENDGSNSIVGVEPKLRVDSANWVQLLNSSTSHPIEFEMSKIYLENFDKHLAVIKILKIKLDQF